MADSWKTKDGFRRIRREPPTIREAIDAAQGLTPDPEQQVLFAAQLMGVSDTDVRAELRHVPVLPRTISSVVTPSRDKGSRLVVVERRVSRRRLDVPAARSGTNR